MCVCLTAWYCFSLTSALYLPIFSYFLIVTCSVASSLIRLLLQRLFLVPGILRVTGPVYITEQTEADSTSPVWQQQRCLILGWLSWYNQKKMIIKLLYLKSSCITRDFSQIFFSQNQQNKCLHVSAKPQMSSTGCFFMLQLHVGWVSFPVSFLS